MWYILHWLKSIFLELQVYWSCSSKKMLFLERKWGWLVLTPDCALIPGYVPHNNIFVYLTSTSISESRLWAGGSPATPLPLPNATHGGSCGNCAEARHLDASHWSQQPTRFTKWLESWPQGVCLYGWLFPCLPRGAWVCYCRGRPCTATTAPFPSFSEGRLRSHWYVGINVDHTCFSGFSSSFPAEDGPGDRTVLSPVAAGEMVSTEIWLRFDQEPITQVMVPWFNQPEDH